MALADPLAWHEGGSPSTATADASSHVVTGRDLSEVLAARDRGRRRARALRAERTGRAGRAGRAGHA